METSIDPRIRPSLSDLASAHGEMSRGAGPGVDSPEGPGRKAFAHYRTTGTDEVTTLGPDRETKTVEAPLRFRDLVDLVNPLHHIPVVSSLYRSVSGDEIVPAARIFGSMIYTGPLGFVYATVDSLFAEMSGRPFGDTLVSAVFGGGEAGQAEPADLADSRARVAPEAAGGSDPPEGTPPAAEGGTGGDGPAGKEAATGGELLTGKDALRALATDLRLFARPAIGGGGSFDSEDAVRSGPEATPAAALFPAPQSGRPLPSAESPQLSEAFARKMTEALDKYRAMAEARRLEEERRPVRPQAPAEIP